MANADIFDAYFRRADLDHDGRISGGEAVGFFQGAGLPQVILAKIWQFADQGRTGFLSRLEFYNALKLVTVAQTGRELTPELVKAALTGPAAAQIPPPRINTPAAPPSNLGQTPPQSQTPQQTAPQGNYGQQFSAQGVNFQQPRPQEGFGGLQGPQFSSQGGTVPQISQTQSRFSSVGSLPQSAAGMHQPPRPGAPTAGPASAQARPSVGGLFGGESSWPPSKTSSLPPGVQLSSSLSLTAASGFQLTPTQGTSRPITPGSTLLTATSLPDVFGAGSLPAGTDLFGSGFKATGSGALKTGSGSFGSGDLFAVAPPTRPAGASLPPSKSKSTSELQASGESLRADPVGPMALVPTALPSSANLAKPSAVSQTMPVSSDSGPGFSARSLSGPGVTLPWPRMTQNDVQRYSRIFSKVDTDHDGKITGEQARDLFLSWQLPRGGPSSHTNYVLRHQTLDGTKEVLKQVWDLSDQDGDSMLSVREFCTALYLMERFREGRPLPPVLPPGIHLDDSRHPDAQGPGFQRPGGYSGYQMQQTQGVPQHVAPGSSPVPVRPTLLTTPAGQMHLQSLTSAGGGGPEAGGQASRDLKAAFGEFNFVNQTRRPEKDFPKAVARDAVDSSKKVAELDKQIMDHKEKTEYYRTKLQEIVLFKSRCDNKLAEITERAAADKREVDSLAKKYDEKFKAAAEVNSQLAAEETAAQEVQARKMELFDALVKMDRGGNPNALLQTRSDRIATDLDKLRKALHDRAKLLGVEVKQKIPKEMPFGWQPSIQEKATEWNEDWDKFDDEGYSAVQDYMDETTEEAPVSLDAKPSAAASWGMEGKRALEDDFDQGSATPKEASPSVVGPASADVKLQETGESLTKSEVEGVGDDLSTSGSHGDEKSGLTTSASGKRSERYANVVDSQEFGSDTFNGPTATSSPTNSSEQGRTSFTSDAFGGNGTSWGFGMHEDEADSGARASWGLQSNPPSTQTSLDVSSSRKATRFGKSAGSFGLTGDSFDLGSPQHSSIDGRSSPAHSFERNGNSHSQDFDTLESFNSLGTSKDSNKMSSFYGGNISTQGVPATPLFGGSPGASKREDGFNGSFLRFDSFGPGSPVAVPHVSGASEDRTGGFLNRFDSFNSVQTDGGARGSGFHSDDESDIFAGTGPFSATTPHGPDRWRAF